MNILLPLVRPFRSRKQFSPVNFSFIFGRIHYRSLIAASGRFVLSAQAVIFPISPRAEQTRSSSFRRLLSSGNLNMR